MWIFAKLKLWEVLLVVALCLLGALVYEIHNSPSRYIPLDVNHLIFDSSTGSYWKYTAVDDSTKEWTRIIPPIPNRSHSIED